MTNLLRRWRLILGPDVDKNQTSLDPKDKDIDQLLNQIYDKSNPKAKSKKDLKKWLEGIRENFSAEVVSILQKDALLKKKYKEMLLEPELLEKTEANLELVKEILQIHDLMPDKTKHIAREIVHKLVSELEQKLKKNITRAFTNKTINASKRGNPNSGNVDWKKTISRNLKHYQSNYNTIIPENWFISKQKNKTPEIFLIIDTSESMIESAIYSAVIASVLASINSVKTHIIFFNEEVMDLTDQHPDPTELIFNIPLGGGTDIAKAMQYTIGKINNLSESYVFLTSDMDEYGDVNKLIHSIRYIIQHQGTIIGIFGLDHEGNHVVNHNVLDRITDTGMKCLTCKPEDFPNLLVKHLYENNNVLH